ncbi:MAG: DNA/RNA nuclease SfsA [Lentisphaeria bacterium]|nr:DNA/RNA nuclease SfsA [Lentisphaeria bacterium]
MRYETIKSGIFRERPNRFTACVETEGSRETVHVKNTGRCRELLIPGVRVYLSQAGNMENRKTKYDLVCVEKRRPGRKPLLINMDSQIPNDAAEEWLKTGELFGKTARIRREVTYGGSRFDFRIDDEKGQCHYLEVKGVTLEENGVALFPDAPTERGVRHLKELAACAKAGFGAWLLFVIQMKGMRVFRPNWTMHEDFARALLEARRCGVKILARECDVTPESMTVAGPVPVELQKKNRF